MEAIKLKPFCVKSSDLTDQDLNVILKRCVEFGVNRYDWIRGFDVVYCEEYFNRCQYRYWGVDKDYDTYTCEALGRFNDNLLTKEEAFEMLGIETKGGKPVPRLEPFCVFSQNISEEDLLLILNKCKELGACVHEWVATPETVMEYSKLVDKDCHTYWGLTFVYDAYSSNNKEVFDNNVLTKEEAFELLGIDNTTVHKEDPKSADTVLGLLQEVNLSLTMNKTGITITDEETGIDYKMPNEEDIVDFIEKFKVIKEYTKN